MKDLPVPAGEIPKENLQTPTPYVDPLANLPEYVKHPKNYERIEKALLETLSCGKVHSDPLQMVDCMKCAENMRTRRELMKRFGFEDVKMYMSWRKRQQEIKNKLPHDLYQKLIRGEEVKL